MRQPIPDGSSELAPLFDMLTGRSGPYTGFGDPLPESPARLQRFRALIDEAHTRLAEGLGCDPKDPHLVPGRLSGIVKRMRAEGWSPQRNNTDLFARDFGLALTAAVLAAHGGSLVFRSERDMSHLSIWWPTYRIEAFPFHNVLKCLLEPVGSSMDFFFRGLSTSIDEAKRKLM